MASSVFGRERVVAVTVPGSNSAITPVNDQFTRLISRDLSSALDRLRLLVDNPGVPRCVLRTDRPLGPSPYDVLIRHEDCWFCRTVIGSTVCSVSGDSLHCKRNLSENGVLGF